MSSAARTFANNPIPRRPDPERARSGHVLVRRLRRPAPDLADAVDPRPSVALLPCITKLGYHDYDTDMRVDWGSSIELNS